MVVQGVTEVSIPMDLGTIVDTRSARMEVFDRRSRRQKTSCGGGVEFEKVFRPIQHERHPRQGGQSPWPIVVSPIADSVI